jgi:hypothetical protein
MNKLSQTPEIEKMVQKLFWSTPPACKADLSAEVIVEQTLNYGNMQDVKALIDWLGIDQAADVFYEQVRKKRNNYRPRTLYFFSLYFNRHAHRRT